LVARAQGDGIVRQGLRSRDSHRIGLVQHRRHLVLARSRSGCAESTPSRHCAQLAGAQVMNRRDYLKSSALPLTGAVLSGCSDDATDGADSSPTTSATRAETYGYTSPLETSGWTATSGVSAGYAALEDDIDVDVAVVGAGLAGSPLALHLAESGVSVAVLESRQPGWGASGRNAGHVLPTLRSIDAIRRFPDGGKAFLEAFREHHTIPFDLARKHGLACDATQAGYLHATSRRGVFDDLKDKSRYWREQQGQQVEWLEGKDVEAITGTGHFGHGVLYRSGGRVNPYLFTRGLIAAAVRNGARVFGETEALALAQAGERWRVTTAQGGVLADRVVFCTNAYATGVLPQFANSFYPLTAYGVATQPLPQEALELILPGRATLAEEPLDLNPCLIDEHGRLVTASIPSSTRPDDAAWHFGNHLSWVHRTWPQTRDMDIRMDHYWTGRVALRDVDFPGVL